MCANNCANSNAYDKRIVFKGRLRFMRLIPLTRQRSAKPKTSASECKRCECSHAHQHNNDRFTCAAEVFMLRHRSPCRRRGHLWPLWPNRCGAAVRTK